jgi:hypothetical protein
MTHESSLDSLETMWSIAKKCQGITIFDKEVSLNKRCYKDNPFYTSNGQHKIDVSRIDIVAEHESKWIKVSNFTEDRILRDIYKSDWSGQSDHESYGDDDEDFDLIIPLFKTATNLVKASRRERVQLTHSLSIPN